MDCSSLDYKLVKSPSVVFTSLFFNSINCLYLKYCYKDNRFMTFIVFLNFRPAPENEDEMMEAIFEYIDRIFNIVRPRKVLYMAIDGVVRLFERERDRERGGGEGEGERETFTLLYSFRLLELK